MCKNQIIVGRKPENSNLTKLYIVGYGMINERIEGKGENIAVLKTGRGFINGDKSIVEQKKDLVI